MRITMAVILLFSVCSAGLAEQQPCSVPVSVTVHDLSSLPRGTAEAMVNEWKQNIRAKKYELPDGRWDWSRESWDFQKALIARETWDILKRPSARALQNSIFTGDLSAEAFVARINNEPVRVQSVIIDRGPRRVTFVVENGKKMPEAARKIEAAVISAILSKARPEDSFALLTARGPRVALRFGSSREAVRAAAEELASPPQGKAGGQGVLDAILEATTWFQPPQTGDSVLVVTMGLESRHKAGFSKVRAAVAAGGIRVFGFQLGAYSVDSLSGGSNFDSLYIQGFGKISRLDQTFVLSEGSGGRAVLEDTQQRKQYRLTDERLEELKNKGEMMYEEVTKYYALQLDSVGPGLAVGLTQPVLSQLPWVLIYYPEYVLPCSSTATTAAAETRSKQR